MITRLKFFARHFTFDSHVRQQLHSYCLCSLDTSTDSLMMLYVCVYSHIYIFACVCALWQDQGTNWLQMQGKLPMQFLWFLNLNSNLLAPIGYQGITPTSLENKHVTSPCSMSARHASRLRLSDRNKTFFGERSPWRMDGPWMWVDCEMESRRLKKLALKPMDVIERYTEYFTVRVEVDSLKPAHDELKHVEIRIWELATLQLQELVRQVWGTLLWLDSSVTIGLGSTQFYGREVQLGQLATWCLSSSCPHLRWTNILDWMLKSDNKIRRAWPDHASRPMLGKCFLRSLGVFLQKALVVQTLPKSFLCNSTGQTESTVCCHHAVALLTQADSGTLRPLSPAGIHCSFRISYIKSEWTAKLLEVWKSN